MHGGSRSMSVVAGAVVMVRVVSPYSARGKGKFQVF
jgi:hypothetical protein